MGGARINWDDSEPGGRCRKRKGPWIRRYRDLQKGAELGLQNALLLLEDARVLDQKGSYGHAAALAMHAIEELGKAEICVMRKERVKTVPDWRRARRHKSPGEPQERRQLNRHDDKYWHFLNYINLGEAVARRLGTSEAERHLLIPLFTSGRHFREAKRFDRGRQRTIFVDCTKGKWSSPLDIQRDYSQALLNTWAEHYADWVGQIVRNGWKKTVGPLKNKLQASTAETKPLKAILTKET